MGSEIRSVHFIGIGGTAMASVAVAMREAGFRVAGSDHNVYPPMSTFLEQNGIEIREGYREENLSQKPDLVVIGNALSRGNPEVEAVLESKWRYISLPELLKEFFIRGRRSIVVSGTHGKTTTASLLAWIFESSGRNPSYLIGGVPINLGRGARFTDSDWIILEGDEYDTAFFDKRSKFVHYLPEVALINNLEFDHADIFPDLASIQLSFRRFIEIIPRNGLLVGNGDDPNLGDLLSVNHCPVRRFGFGSVNDVRGEDLELGRDEARFRIGETRFRIPLVGVFNVRNAMAVVVCARHCGISDAAIQHGLDTFEGIKRRMEVRGTAGGVTVIDDFGHHPTALAETIAALRIRYPDRRIWAVFEPRSNTTRRNIFQAELAGALALADETVVAHIARSNLLRPEERLDPEKLMNDLHAAGKSAVYLPDTNSIVGHIAARAGEQDVVCVFSNGGFDDIHRKLLGSLGESVAGERTAGSTAIR